MILCSIAAQSPARAQSALSMVGHKTVTCPVCGAEFEAHAVLQTNTFGGVDRDFFARAVGPQPVAYRVSSCPTCAFSGYLDDFEATTQIPPDLADRFLTPPGLRPAGIADDVSLNDLPAPQRYAMAIATYRLLNRSTEARAWLHLRASWAIRDQAHVPPTPPVPLLFAWVETLLPPHTAGENQADRELMLATEVAARIGEGECLGPARSPAKLILAFLLRRHGENAAAQPLLAQLAADGSLSDPLRDAAIAMRDSIAQERAQQDEAVELFRRTLFVGGVTEPNLGPATYLVGELNRRLDRDREAISWYRRALETPGLPDDLKTWSAEQMRNIEAPMRK